MENTKTKLTDAQLLEGLIKAITEDFPNAHIEVTKDGIIADGVLLSFAKMIELNSDNN